MKAFALVIGLLLAAYSWTAQACSFVIDETEMKNTLVFAAANEFGVGLHQTTKIQVKNYRRFLEGVVPGSSCEKFMVFEADVVITYRKGLAETCELSTRVIRREDLHAESYPYYQHEFASVASSCSFTPVIRRPVRPRLPRLG